MHWAVHSLVLNLLSPLFPALQVFRAINPKAVTRNELYGYLHPQTREWKEGLASHAPSGNYHYACRGRGLMWVVRV